MEIASQGGRSRELHFSPLKPENGSEAAVSLQSYMTRQGYQLLLELGSDQRLNTPANKEQIRNLQRNFRRQTGSNDIVSVMFALSREYPSIKLMITSPGLVIVQAEPEMIVYAR